ncbi:MAG: response regulator transcription factor [Streptosporangiaceae bacterium]
MIRLLVADDQALVRDGFCSILGREPDIEIVAEAADGAEAVAAVNRTRPDVALLDIRMPVMDGLQAGRRILAAPDAPRVLMLTTFDADEYVYEALRCGASGFLLKDVRSGQLVEAVRTVAAGQSLLSPAITRRLIERFIMAGPGVPGQPRELAELTPREREVLLLIAEGLSNAEIAGRLYVSEAMVKTHVNRLLAKLGLRDRVQAVVLAYESGIIAPGARSRQDRR